MDQFGEEQHVSIIDPTSQAMSWTKRVLFRPFNLVRWMAIGFCAWLVSPGKGAGGGININMPSGGPGGLSSSDMEQAKQWVLSHLDAIIIAAAALVILVIVLSLVFLWLSSRAKFMFLDNVVRNRQEIAEPWRLFAEQGNSLFVFRLVLGLLVFLATVLVLGLAFLPFVPSIQAQQVLPSLWAGVALAIVLIPCWFLIVGFINLMLGDLVVPVMYRRRCRATEAWGEVWELVKTNPGTMALYYLFRLLVDVAVGIGTQLAKLVIIVITCGLFCCLAMIPFVNLLATYVLAVAVLPLTVFVRSYSVYFLAQFHPDYVMLPVDPDDYGDAEGVVEPRPAR